MATVTLYENVAENLRDAIARAGINQSELSRRSGVTCATISKILNGKMEPSLSLCEQLAKALGVRADLIFIQPSKTTA